MHLATGIYTQHKKIVTAIRQHDSDIVQAHLLRAAFLTGKACRQLGKPLVVTTHNYVKTKYYKNVDKLVPPTDDQKRYLLSQGVAIERIARIDHFSSHQAVAQVKKPDSPTTFISYGRFVKKKGFDILLKAFAKTLAKTNQDIKLIIGGKGPEQEPLFSLSKELNIEAKVSFPGWVDNVEEFLRQGVFILPSFDEPFGIVILEAMAAGLPIITTKTKGPMEILDSSTALFAEIRDVKTLSDAMTVAVDQPSLVYELAENSLKRFKEKYSKEIILPQFEQLFDSLIPPKH